MSKRRLIGESKLEFTQAQILSMEQGYIKSNFLTQAKPANLKCFYERYADKLLGYVLAIVKKRPIAEDIVVKTFANIFADNNLISEGNYITTWSRLTAFVQAEISALQNAAKECKTVNENVTYIQTHRHLSRMTHVQQLVFCGAYYHRKPIQLLAKETGLPVTELQTALKEAFMIIREVKDEN